MAKEAKKDEVAIKINANGLVATKSTAANPYAKIGTIMEFDLETAKKVIEGGLVELI